MYHSSYCILQKNSYEVFGHRLRKIKCKSILCPRASSIKEYNGELDGQHVIVWRWTNDLTGLLSTTWINTLLTSEIFRRISHKYHVKIEPIYSHAEIFHSVMINFTISDSRAAARADVNTRTREWLNEWVTQCTVPDFTRSYPLRQSLTFNTTVHGEWSNNIISTLIAHVNHGHWLS